MKFAKGFWEVIAGKGKGSVQAEGLAWRFDDRPVKGSADSPQAVVKGGQTQAAPLQGVEAPGVRGRSSAKNEI